MATERPMGEPSRQHKASPIYQEVCNIQKAIFAIVGKIEKSKTYTPTRDSLDELAEKIIDICNTYHGTIAPWDKYLKIAIIDLTEVPVIMAPELQRIAFSAALKEASSNLDQFLAGTW